MKIYQNFLKRVIDTLLAACGLVVCAIPMGIIAIAIKCDSKGPVFFYQKRLGKGLKPFRIFKFRTMCDHAYEMGGIATSAFDSRITKVGAFLRRTSLDEIPQMFNIIKGEMSIIGPRPILDWEFEPYKDNSEYRTRYDVRPGMFCTVDLDLRASADRDTQFDMDAQYVKDISFHLDAKTFLGIISTVVLGKNVYKNELQ